MYRSAWMLEKLNQQIDKKKKSRGQKGKTETAAPSSAPATGKKGKGKGGAGSADTFELEQIIEELQNEIKIKDSEFQEMRDELDQFKSQYNQIMTKFKVEKI
jgi:uncharacterized coiled-coil DUF342 family protein